MDTSPTGICGAAGIGFTSDAGVDDIGPVGRGCGGGGLVGIGPEAAASDGGGGGGAEACGAGAAFGSEGLAPASATATIRKSNCQGGNIIFLYNVSKDVIDGLSLFTCL